MFQNYGQNKDCRAPTLSLLNHKAYFQVHLHTQDGIADVKNLGFAAPVGMHSLAPVTYTIVSDCN